MSGEKVFLYSIWSFSQIMRRELMGKVTSDGQISDFIVLGNANSVKMGADLAAITRPGTNFHTHLNVADIFYRPPSSEDILRLISSSVGSTIEMEEIILAREGIYKYHVESTYINYLKGLFFGLANNQIQSWKSQLLQKINQMITNMVKASNPEKGLEQYMADLKSQHHVVVNFTKWSNEDIQSSGINSLPVPISNMISLSNS